jgi:DNA-binding response OmpR family regulator
MQKIQEIEHINPQLIILDFIFGERKLGWQMLQLLKMQRSTASIPIIICTAAESAVRDQEGYLVSQGIQIVYKPFDIDVLLLAIKRALETNGKTL